MELLLFHVFVPGLPTLTRGGVSSSIGSRYQLHSRLSDVSKRSLVAAVVQAFEWSGPRQIKTVCLHFVLLPEVINLRCFYKL